MLVSVWTVCVGKPGMQHLNCLYFSHAYMYWNWFTKDMIYILYDFRVSIGSMVHVAVT